MSGRTDWVQVWEGLRGSTDFAAVCSAGQQLANGLVAARIAWREREAETHAERAQLESKIEELQSALDANDDVDGLGSVVRAWHDAQHSTPWMVCDHPVCRAVVLDYPAVQAAARLDVLLERTQS